jgi:hypothetical protein
LINVFAVNVCEARNTGELLEFGDGADADNLYSDQFTPMLKNAITDLFIVITGPQR